MKFARTVLEHEISEVNRGKETSRVDDQNVQSYFVLFIFVLFLFYRKKKLPSN